MLHSLHATTLRVTARAALVLLFLAPAHVGADTLYMRIDGVPGSGDASAPLGADGFPVLGFTVTAGEEATNPGAATVPNPGPTVFADVSFQMSVDTPVVPLWQLAAEGKVQPKASFVALDAETGKVRYRIDLDQVLVRSLGLQTLGGAREAVVGSLGYQRIRLTHGEGKDAVSTSWDRVRNALWK